MRGWAIGTAVLLSGPALWAQTVHSLNDVPGALTTPDGKSTGARQMPGAEPPDHLGLKLPAGMTAAAVAAPLLPAGDPAPLNAVGVKPVPGEMGRFAAIVCTGGDVPAHPDDTRCSAYSGEDAVKSLTVYVGPVRMTAAAGPVAVAGGRRYQGGLAQHRSAGCAGCTARRRLGYDSGRQLLGLRSRALFRCPGRARLRVARQMGGWIFRGMAEYRDIAGDWHKDHKRDHHITDLADLLIVPPHSSEGYFDPRLNRRGGKVSELFRWAAGMYWRAGS